MGLFSKVWSALIDVKCIRCGSIADKKYCTKCAEAEKKDRLQVKASSVVERRKYTKKELSRADNTPLIDYSPFHSSNHHHYDSGSSSHHHHHDSGSHSYSSHDSCSYDSSSSCDSSSCCSSD